MRLAVLIIILLELLSFFGWALPAFGNVAMLVIVLLVAIVSIQDLRVGIAITASELAIGSHGYLFAFVQEGLSISLRIGLFLVLCSVALVKAMREKNLMVWSSPYRWPLLAMALAVALAIARGAQTGNSFANIFFDANAFLFFASALVLWQGIKHIDDIRFVLSVAFAAVLASTGKALFLLYMFSHKLWWALPETYRWVRDTRIGELTQMTDSFFRIFFQSQIYAVMAFFIVLAFMAWFMHRDGWRASLRTRSWRMLALALVALMASTLISLSRSNWMGMVVAFCVLPLLVWRAGFPIIAWMRNSALTVIASMVLGLILIAGIILVPFPPAGGSFSGSLFGSRALTFDNEAGVGSRWALLSPLWQAIAKQPIMGQGFGTEVTYTTQDPRLLAQNPTGEYTTFIFEWGYHDLWLKLGLFGLASYAYLLFVLMRAGWHYLGHSEPGSEQILVIGLLTGVVSLLVTHTTSPYINHPLGISYLLFCAVFIDVLTRNKPIIDRSQGRS